MSTLLLEFWNALSEMAPYLLVGFALAGALSVLVPPDIVERHLGGRGLGSVFKASLFGVPLPLCSCGVIPVAASLRRHGASKGATTSFLLSTPQTGVDSIFVTLSLLGPVFAVFRPLAALVTGVVGGFLVDRIDPNGAVPATAEDPACGDCSLLEGESRSRLRRALRYGFVTLPRDIAKPILAGMTIAALIAAFIPDGFFGALIGSSFVAMLVMMAVGIPVYVCATASVPIAAALIAKGVSPGAALVFLMTGPATNAATLATIWKVLGRRTALIYLATVAVAALVFGALLDRVFTVTGIPAAHASHWMMPYPVKAAAGAALLALLVAALLPRKRRLALARTAAAGGVALKISGMTCSRCAESVKRALLECPGVRQADVSLDERRAVVRGEGVDPAKLCAAIEQLGYKAEQPAR
ncbi:MAG: SO_0444 family Cu/Zn efflux transporter [Kiritimatiellae bacterium]|nr:SO_0444 family Cu/Zn efflux transporter [Kiritimatiellia bacterium]